MCFGSRNVLMASCKVIINHENIEAGLMIQAAIRFCITCLKIHYIGKSQGEI